MKTVTHASIKQEIDQLSPEQLVEVSNFIGYLKFRKHRVSSINLDINELAKLSTEFADDDRQFAETGMNDYANLLNQTDNS